ncbi:MAG: efflux RND transporter periplasmic adaptor subunit [Phycisphaerae bacterium]
MASRIVRGVIGIGLGAWPALVVLAADPATAPPPAAAPDGADVVRVAGRLEPAEVYEVAPAVRGAVVKVEADAGDAVKAGQVLAVVAPERYEAALQQARAGVARAEGGMMQARANVERAKMQVERTARLSAASAVSREEADAAAADVRTAEAVLRIADAGIEEARAVAKVAELDLAATRVLAPADGIVLARGCTLGQVVGGGDAGAAKPLFVIAASPNRLRLVVRVSERDSVRVKAGQAVSVAVRAIEGKPVRGVVKRVGIAPDGNSGTFPVFVDVPNDDGALRPFWSAEGTIAVGPQRE